MLTENSLYIEQITMVAINCCSCGILFGVPSNLNNKFKNDPDMWFYCPNGHRQHYSESASEKEKKKLKRQLDEAENKLASKDWAIENLSATNNMLQNQVKKAKKKLDRVAKGVCPCCNRSFVNLQQHMASQHPGEVKKNKNQ